MQSQRDALRLQATIGALAMTANSAPIYREAIDVRRGRLPAPRQEEEDSQPTVVIQRVGRNKPCLCGSGKKFKVCCRR